MVRRPRTGIATPSAMDPRVKFHPVPDARRLVTVEPGGWFSLSGIQDAIVWLKPGEHTDEELEQAQQRLLADGAAAAVRLLPRAVGDALLPAEAGSAAEVSSVSEVRPVVAELVVELPKDLQADTAALIDRLLSEVGL